MKDLRLAYVSQNELFSNYFTDLSLSREERYMHIFRTSRIYEYLEETDEHKRQTKIPSLTDSNPRGRKSLSHLRFKRRRLENIYVIR